MPEIVRATGGRHSAHQRRRGFFTAIAAALALGAPPAQAELLSDKLGLHHFDVYIEAFSELNRSDIVALVLMLGVLLFNYPVLALFNVSGAIFGIPVLYAYIFVAWAALIALMAFVAESRGRDRR